MKSVPPLACSNLPLRCLMAEVKAPRSWPNSSLSISSEGMAAQFTSTKGKAERALLAWSQRATSSLPVPFSPVMSTRASDGATLSISCLTCSIWGEVPMICSVAQGFDRRVDGGLRREDDEGHIDLGHAAALVGEDHVEGDAAAHLRGGGFGLCPLRGEALELEPLAQGVSHTF